LIKRTGKKRVKVVAIGGGSGLYTTLVALRQLEVEITAIVSVADSGGSSGRLRDEFGILPPGDVRRALLALSDLPFAQAILRQLFEYRFDNGFELKGHSFGNLFLTALTGILEREDKAIAAAGKILQTVGKVFPVSLGKTTLCARLEDGTIIKGETNIDIRRVRPDLKILDVFLNPVVKIFPGAKKAIEVSDLIILGPGDLYTSLIPNLLVEGVNEAIGSSRGELVYICNLMTKKGETDGFKVRDFIAEIGRHLGRAEAKLKTVLVNDRFVLPREIKKRYRQEGAIPVEIDGQGLKSGRPKVIMADLAAVGQLWRHDSQKMAKAIKNLLPGELF